MFRSALLALLLLTPSVAPAQESLRLRMYDLGNRIGGLVTNDPAGHQLITVQNRLDLKLSLIAQKQREIGVLEVEAQQLIDQLTAMTGRRYEPLSLMTEPARGVPHYEIVTCPLGQDICQ